MTVSETDSTLSLQIPDKFAGQRLDQALAELFSQFSRSRLQQWLNDGELLVDGKSVKANKKVLGGEFIQILKQGKDENSAYEGEDVPIDIVYEDNEILVINKPRDMVVHPGSGNWSGTLLNGVLFKYPKNKEIPRAGIVHRLDKNTTGLMVIAKTIESQTSLVRQLQSRTVRREYYALVNGRMPKSGMIDDPIGRHPRNRKKMAIVSTGKHAVTHFKTTRLGTAWSAISCLLETGRTHQIRVHLTSIGHSIIGDPTYTGHSKHYDALLKTLSFDRQALHATSLSLKHPKSDEEMTWTAEAPSDMQSLASALKSADDEPT